MTRTLMAAGLATGLCIALATPAHAISLGGHIGFGSGESNDGFDVDYTQLGFTLDTGRDGRLFQYRLHAGYLEVEYEGGAEQSGITFDNHFGFALNPGADVRFWLAPSVYVSITDGDLDSGSYLGVGPTFGVDFPVGGSKMGVELSYRESWHSFSQEDDDGNVIWTGSETFSDVILRATFLF